MSDQGPQNALPFGPYLLLRRIAVGGMAELYLGSEPRAGRFIVLKRILPHMAEEPEFVKMFLDEARIAGSVHHPNIIDVYELGQIDKSIFITMEWVEGMDLRRVLQREQARGGVVPPGIAAWLMARLCEGLQYAHTRIGDDGRPLGIIHRDVSPQNIMVSYRGEVKLVDFGIAKATAWISRSKPGIIKGKFLYLAPEQLSEEVLDSRTDLFSLGTMLYELTTGQSPFYRPETEGVIYAIRVEEPAPPHTLRPGYPISLSRIIQKCLVKDRDHRYQTADDIRIALEDALLVDMPTTRADVINYIAGLFGNDVERTSVYVPPNVPAHELKKRDPPTLAEEEDEEEEENTASMPPPKGYRPPQATLVDDEDDDDDEATALIDVPDRAERLDRNYESGSVRAEPVEAVLGRLDTLGVNGSSLRNSGQPSEPVEVSPRRLDKLGVNGSARPRPSPPERTVPMNERPGPPVPSDVQDLSYESVPFSLPSPPAPTEPSKRGRLPSMPSVQVDLEALLPTPVTKQKTLVTREDLDELSANSQSGETSHPTEMQIPAYPPIAGPLIRPGPPVKDEPTELRVEPRRSEKPGPPVDSGSRAPVAPAKMPEAPARQPPPQPRVVGPGPTNLNPLDPLETGEPKALKPRRGKRIVKRRVAGDPEDHIATVDFRDAGDDLSVSQSQPSEEYQQPTSNTWLIAATIVLASFALVMIIWLVWPSAPVQLPDRPSDSLHAEPPPLVTSPKSKPLPGLVNVQFRAAKTTQIFLDGAAINPGEIRAIPPGPLTLAYRCMPTKRGQKPRDLTLATKVTEGGAQPFIVEVSCR